MPFSVRFLLDDDLVDETVVDVVDSALLTAPVGRFVRLAFDDKDESFEARGRLSTDDCDDAAETENVKHL